MQMRKILVSFAGLLAAAASAQSLRITTVGPGVYCHFSANCQVSPTTQSDSFTPTNALVLCTLESRSFPGTSMDSTGTYGYEYRLTLSNNGAMGTNILTVSALTVNFGEPAAFAYGEHASNQVWVVSSTNLLDASPSSANFSDKQVTFQFDPPLLLNTATNQSISTCYFGMAGGGAPETTTATVAGSAQNTAAAPISFSASLQAQTP